MADTKKTCGIVMPISECDGLGPRHWSDVLSIISSAAESAGFDARLVSDTDGSNLIHKEILHNIYHDDIVICDVSGRNPNVFFELGIRMATRKPTVIVKDRDTAYPFDTGPNRYVEYPRDLRHPEMEVFKRKLKDALEKTMDHSPEQSFIGQLGPFKVLDVETKASSSEEVILERLDQIERVVARASAAKENILPKTESLRIFTDSPKLQVFARQVGTEMSKILISGYKTMDIGKAILRVSEQDAFRHLEFYQDDRIVGISVVNVVGDVHDLDDLNAAFEGALTEVSST